MAKDGLAIMLGVPKGKDSKGESSEGSAAQDLIDAIADKDAGAVKAAFALLMDECGGYEDEDDTDAEA